jgi:beta-glucosidase
MLANLGATIKALLAGACVIKVCMSSHEFIWGVANSAFQVEGDPAPSDWKAWTEKKSKIKDGATASKATNFWERFEEDFLLAKKLGCKAFRLSIAWERVEPEEGIFNSKAIEHYAAMLSKLQEQGLEPFVTLNHFVLPTWLAKKGGYHCEKFHEYFVRFALKFFEEILSKRALFSKCMTFNEPMVAVFAGYLQGIWPPGKTDSHDLAMQAAFQMAKAHVETYRQAKPSASTLQLGIAQHWRVFQPKRKVSVVDHLLARLSHWSFNVQFIESLTKGKIFFWTLGSKTHREADVPANTLDFLGINYYGRILVGAQLQSPFVSIEEGPGEKTDLGWEIYPEGLGRALEDAHRVYQGPLYVTENGLADHGDAKRSKFLEEHVHYLLKARQHLPVQGYFHWSLTDNFEWAEGLEPRFGLVEIDYATGERKERPSYFTYQKLIRDGLSS